MRNSGSADAIRSYVHANYIVPARRKGIKRVQIVAGDVHRGLKLKNRVSNVCTVLTSRTLLQKNHLLLEEQEGPPSGMSTTMTYTYRLLEEANASAAPATPDFDSLRGLLKGPLKSLGGGEAFLRRERRGFYRSSRASKS